MDRLVTFRPPRGGIPGADIEDGGAIAARVPVYGHSDSGRRFWLTVKKVFAAAGFTMNQILSAVFSISKDGTIQAMVVTHVDDFLLTALPAAEQQMQRVLDDFGIAKIETRELRFCGKEFSQDEQFNIKITCKDNAEKINPVRYDRTRKLTSLANDD